MPYKSQQFEYIVGDDTSKKFRIDRDEYLKDPAAFQKKNPTARVRMVKDGKDGYVSVENINRERGNGYHFRSYATVEKQSQPQSTSSRALEMGKALFGSKGTDISGAKVRNAVKEEEEQKKYLSSNDNVIVTDEKGFPTLKENPYSLKTISKNVSTDMDARDFSRSVVNPAVDKYQGGEAKKAIMSSSKSVLGGYDQTSASTQLYKLNSEVSPEAMTKKIAGNKELLDGLQKSLYEKAFKRDANGNIVGYSDEISAYARKNGKTEEKFLTEDIIPNIANNAVSRLYENESDANKIKSTSDYLVKMLYNSIPGQLSQLATRSLSQRTATAEALEDYNSKITDGTVGGFLERTAGEGTKFLGDAFAFGASGLAGKGASYATGTLYKTVGEGILKRFAGNPVGRFLVGASEYALQGAGKSAASKAAVAQGEKVMAANVGVMESFLRRYAAAAPSSFVNLGTFGAISSGVGEMTYSEQPSFASVGRAMIDGFRSMSRDGLVFPVGSSLIGSASSKYASSALDRTLFKTAGFGAEAGTFFGLDYAKTGNATDSFYNSMTMLLGMKAGGMLSHGGRSGERSTRDTGSIFNPKNWKAKWSNFITDTGSALSEKLTKEQVEELQNAFPGKSLEELVQFDFDKRIKRHQSGYLKNTPVRDKNGKIVEEWVDKDGNVVAERDQDPARQRLAEFGLEIANNKDISWETKQKLFGRMFDTVEVNRPITDHTNISGDKVSFYSKDGQLIATRRFNNREELDTFIYNESSRKRVDEIVAEYAELNLTMPDGFTMQVTDKDGNAVDVTPDEYLDMLGVDAGYANALLISDPLKYSEKDTDTLLMYAKGLDDIYESLHKYEAHPEHSASVGEHIADGTDLIGGEGADVVSGLKAEHDSAREEARKVLDSRNAEDIDAILDNADIREMSGYAQNDNDIASFVNYINAKAKYDGFIRRQGIKISEYVDLEWADMSHKGNVDGADNDRASAILVNVEGRQVYLKDGDVDTAKGTISSESGMVLVFDPETGETDFIPVEEAAYAGLVGGDSYKSRRINMIGEDITERYGLVDDREATGGETSGETEGTDATEGETEAEVEPAGEEVPQTEIPTDKDGNKDYSGIEPKVALDDIIRDLGGDTELAGEAIASELDKATKAHKKASEKKPDGIAGARKKAEEVAKTKSAMDMWQKIKDELDDRNSYRNAFGEKVDKESHKDIDENINELIGAIGTDADGKPSTDISRFSDKDTIDIINKVFGMMDMEGLTDAEKTYLNGILASASANGFKACLFTGKPYESRLGISANITIDDSMEPGESIVVKDNQPMILKDGRLVQGAKVEVKASRFDKEDIVSKEDIDGIDGLDKEVAKKAKKYLDGEYNEENALAMEEAITAYHTDKNRALIEELEERLDYLENDREMEDEYDYSVTNEDIDAFEPQTDMDHVATMFLALGLKITPESLERETGWGAREKRQFPGMIAGKAKGGMSIARAADVIFDNLDEPIRERIENSGTDVRNLLIDILSEGNPRSYIRRTIESRTKGLDDAARDYAIARRDEDYHERYGMSYDEWADMEIDHIKKMIDKYRGVNLDALDSETDRLNEEYYNNDKENEQFEGKNRGTEGGDEILPGEGSGEERGTAEGEGRGSDTRDVPTGEGETGTVPEGASEVGGEKPSGEAEGTGSLPRNSKEEAAKFKAEHPLTEDEIDKYAVDEDEADDAKDFLNGEHNDFTRTAYSDIYDRKVKEDAKKPSNGGAEVKSPENEGDSTATSGSKPKNGTGVEGNGSSDSKPKVPRSKEQEDAKKALIDALDGLLNERMGGETLKSIVSDGRIDKDPDLRNRFKKVVDLARNFGYQMVKDGMRDKDAWKADFTEQVGDKAKQIMEMDDQEWSDFLDDLWSNKKHRVGEERMTLAEWAKKFNEQDGKRDDNETVPGTPAGHPTVGTDENPSDNGGQSGGSSKGHSGAESGIEPGTRGGTTGGTGEYAPDDIGPDDAPEPGSAEGSSATGNGGKGTAVGGPTGGKSSGTSVDVDGGTGGRGASDNEQGEPKGHPDGNGNIPESDAGDRSGSKALGDKVSLESEKVAYKSRSKAKSLNSVVPAGLNDAMQSNLEQIGDVDDYVVKALGYKNKEELYNALAGEQVDGVALAVKAMRQGYSPIIADQTGLGKGRQAASLLRYAMKQGMKPVFFTEKAALFSDLYRDMVDTGNGDKVPFIIASDAKNAVIRFGDKTINLPSKEEVEEFYRTGKLPRGYDYAVCTYSQIFEKGGQREGVEDNADQIDSNDLQLEGRRKAVAQLCKNNVVIFDESHNAAGANSSSGRYCKQIVRDARGVSFFSATYAKRPEQMAIYSIRSVISDANVSEDNLIRAIERGGAAYQEVLARELAESGALIRRERDMTGTSVDWTKSSVGEEEQREKYDTAIRSFREITRLQNRLAKVIENYARSQYGGRASVKFTSNRSRLFNVTNQLYLALKVEDAVASGVEILKGEEDINGKKVKGKVFIPLHNTNDAFLEQFFGNDEVVDKNDISRILESCLAKSLNFRIISPDVDLPVNAEDILTITNHPLKAELETLREDIKAMELGLSMSPIDALREGFEKAGFNVGEITGRKSSLVRNENGELVHTKRKKPKNNDVVKAYNDGDLDVVIVNDSGSTGLSMHASEKFKDQRKRYCLTIQAMLDVNTEMQIRGRVDRTGQLYHAAYQYLVSHIPAENRLMMMLKAKLKSLDAQTTASQKNTVNDVDTADFANKYGSQVIVEILKEDPTWADAMGDPFGWNSDPRKSPENARESYKAKEKDFDVVMKRVAELTCAEQEEFYELVVDRYTSLIENLTATGMNDLEIRSIPLDAEVKNAGEVIRGEAPGGENVFADSTYVEEVDANNLDKPMTKAELANAVRKGLDGKTGDEVSNDTMKSIDDWADGEVAKVEASAKQRYENRIVRYTEKMQEQAKKKGETIDFNNPEDPYVKRIETEKVIQQDAMDETIENARKKISEKTGTFREALKRFRVGEFIASYRRMTDSSMEYFDGVVIGFDISKGRNPATSFINIASSTGQKLLKIPFSDSYAIAHVNNGMREEHKDPIANWDSIARHGHDRETRYIFTGNIMNALVQGRKGQLVNYTEKDGTVRLGMLLPKGVSLSDIGRRRKLVEAYDRVKDFSRDRKGKLVTSDKRFTIQYVKDGSRWYNDDRWELRFAKNSRTTEILKDRGLAEAAGWTFAPDATEFFGDNEKTAILQIRNTDKLKDVMRYLTDHYNAEFDDAIDWNAQAAERNLPEVTRGNDYSIKSVREHYQKLVKDGGEYDPEIQQLAEDVFDVAEALGVKVQYGRAGSNKGVMGYFDPKTKTIRYKYNHIMYGDKHEAAETILHETIHAVTSYAFYAKRRGNKMSKELEEAVNEIIEIQQLIKKDPQFGPWIELNPFSKEWYGAWDYNGGNPGHENVAEMANPKWRDRLKSINLWERFKHAVGNIIKALWTDLGLPAKDKTAFERMNNALYKLLDNFDKQLFDEIMGENNWDGEEGGLAKILNPKNAGGDLSEEGKVRREIYENKELIRGRSEIDFVAKELGGVIGDASAGAYIGKDGRPDPKKAKTIGSNMVTALNDYLSTLNKVRGHQFGAPTVRDRVFSEHIADVKKAIDFYERFANGEKVDHADEGIRFRSDEKPRSASGVRLFDEAENIKNSYSNLSSEDLFVSLQDSNSNKVKYDKALELARRILTGETRVAGALSEGVRGTQSLLGTAASIIARRRSQDFLGKIRSLRGQEKYLVQQEANKAIMKDLLEFAKQGNFLVEEIEVNDDDSLFGTPVLMLNGKALTKGYPFSYHAESRVFESIDGTSVIKQGHAKGADSKNNTIADRLENMMLFNNLFGDTPHELIGIRDSGNGNCELIWKQNFIRGTELSRLTDPKTGLTYTIEKRKEMLDEYMMNVFGMEPVVDGRKEYYTDGIFDVDDVRYNHDNVIVTKDGQMFIIDGFVRNSESDYLGEIIRDNPSFTDFAEFGNASQTNGIAKVAQGQIDVLGGNGRVHTSLDSITDSRVREDIESGRNIKGWYDTRTGEVHIFAPNCESEYDAQRTVFHEKVGHEGLRKVMGEENFKKFLHRVFGGITGDARKALIEEAAKRGWDFDTAIDEYLAKKAEDFADTPENRTLWQKVKDTFNAVLRAMGMKSSMTENDIREALWLSKNNLENKTGSLEYKIRKKAFDARLKRNVPKEQMSEDKAMFTEGKTSGTTLYSSAGMRDKSIPTPLGTSDRAIYDEGIEHWRYLWTEAHQNGLRSLQLAQQAVMGKGREVKDSENAFLALNRLGSTDMTEMEKFKRVHSEPLTDAISEILPNFDGKNVNERYRNLEKYLMAKHGLERNRTFFVRDALKALSASGDPADIAMAKQLQVDYDALRGSAKRQLDSGAITLADYFDTIDNFIRTEIKDDYDASMNDKSGLSDKDFFDWVNADGSYDDAAVISHVMDCETKMGKDVADDLWAKIKGVTDYSLDKRYEGGLDSKASYNRAKSMFDWYVPLRGFDADTAEDLYNYEGTSGKPSVTGMMHADMRTSAARNPIATMIVMANGAIMQSNRNVAKQHLFRLAHNNANPLFTEMNLWYEKKQDAYGNEYLEPIYPDINFIGGKEKLTAAEMDKAIENYENLIETLKADPNREIVFDRARHGDLEIKFERESDSEQHMIHVMIGGKRRTLFVNGNPRVAQAVNGLIRDKKAPLVKSLNNWMSKMATSKSATFIMRNGTRDWEYASTSVEATEGHSYFVRFEKNYARLGMTGMNKHSMRSLLTRFEEDNLDMNDEIDRYFKEFMENGGRTGFVQMSNVEEQQKEIEKLIKKGKVTTAGKSKMIEIVPNAIGKLGRAWFGMVEGLNEAVENQTRFAAYMTSRQYKKRTIARSIYDAKNVSVNFNLSGAGFGTYSMKTKNESFWHKTNRLAASITASYMRNFVIFYNAGVQGMSRTAQVAFGGDKRQTMKAIAGMAAFPMALGCMMPVLNQIMTYRDDDDDKKKFGDNPYAQLPEYERRQNFCFYIGKGQFVKIPIAIELRAFYGIGDLAAGGLGRMGIYDKAKGLDAVGITDPENGASVAGHYLYGLVKEIAQITPADIFGGSKALDKGIAGGVAGLLIPSSVAPLLAAGLAGAFDVHGTNVGWTGSPVSRRAFYNKNNKPEWDKAATRTNKTIIDLTKSLSDATGGNNVEGGWINLNPSELEYLIEQYGSSGAKDIVLLTSTLLTSAQMGIDYAVDGKSDKEFHADELPGVKAFFRSRTSSNELSVARTRYYNYKEEAQKTNDQLTTYKSNAKRSFDDAVEYTNFKNEVRVGRAAIMKHYDKYIKKLQKAKNDATNVADRNAIQDQINIAMSMAVEEIDRYDEQVSKSKKKR